MQSILPICIFLYETIMHTMSYAKLPYRKVESSLTHMPEGVIRSSSEGGIWEAESDLSFDFTNESKTVLTMERFFRRTLWVTPEQVSKVRLVTRF